jgi:hypothetical protein
MNNIAKTAKTAKEQLNYISTKKDNWDGHGALAVNPLIFESIMDVINRDEKVLNNWKINSNIDGTINMTFDDGVTEGYFKLKEGLKDLSDDHPKNREDRGIYDFKIVYKGKVKESGKDEIYYFTNNIMKIFEKIKRYSDFMEKVEQFAVTGETAFFRQTDTEKLECCYSCNFFYKGDGSIWFRNQIRYGFLERNLKVTDSIQSISYSIYKSVVKLTKDVIEDLIYFQFYNESETRKMKREIQYFKQRTCMIGRSTYNPYDLDINRPKEKVFIKIYNPDNTLLIETPDEILLDHIRVQIKEKKLKGFYITFTSNKRLVRMDIDENGRFTNEGSFPSQYEELATKLLF